MENTFIFREKLIKISVIVVTFFFVLFMSLMVAYAENKVVIVTEDTEESYDDTEIVVASKWMVDIDKSDSEAMGIDLAVSYDITSKDISVATRLTEKKVIVTINSAKDNFYLYNPPKGNFQNVLAAYGEFDGGKVRITFELEHPMECEYSYSNRNITLKLLEVEPYDGTLVLLDPGHGGIQNGIKAGELTEQDIALKIALSVREKAMDKPYKVMLTRDDSATLTTENRLEIADILESDYYVGIHLSSDIENVKTFGMYAAFNDGYYRKGLQNVSFAESVLRNTCISTKNRGIGLVPASEDEVILMALDIPATILYAGYMSNFEELSLLAREEYIEKIADGIINALDETVE